MKRISLLASVLVALAASSGAQTSIPNGNFENWNNISVSKPNGWYTSIDDSPGENSTVKSTEAQNGSFAITLKSIEFNQDVGFGFFANTKGNPLLGEGGKPYSQRPTSFNGYYKGNFVAGDSAIFLVTFKKNGTVISNNIFKIGTNASSYTAFTFPINLTQDPDSVIVAGASSDVLGMTEPVTGNVVTIDNISFGGAGITQVIENGSFENWTNSTQYTLVNWSSYDSEVTRTTQKYKGEAAVMLPVVDYGDGSVYGTTLNLGANNGNNNGIAFTKQNDTLVFYYHFKSVGGDTAMIYASLKKAGNYVGGVYQMLEPNSSYQRLEIPMPTMEAPDTLSLGFNVGTGQMQAHVGSELYIDEVTLKSEPLNTGILNWTKTANLANVYPNPFTTTLNVWAGAFKNITYTITDITGKSLLSGAVENNTIHVELLQQGIYFVTLTSNGQTIAVKKITKE
jgi:hypothetical protein